MMRSACRWVGFNGAPVRPCLKTARPSSAFTPPGSRAALKISTAADLGTERLSSASPASSPPAFIGQSSDHNDQEGIQDAWLPVRQPHWWRKNKPAHCSGRRCKPLPAAARLPTSRSFVKPHKRICRRCLEKGHPAKECRDPVRCRLCRGWRHIAQDCKDRSRSGSASLSPCSGSSSYGPASSRSSSPGSSTSSRAASPSTRASSPATPRPPSTVASSSPSTPPAPNQGMAPRIGDPELRPTEGHVVIQATQEMLNQAARLTNLAAVIRFGNASQGNAADIHAAISFYTKAVGNELRVVPHFPKPYIATFKFKHHRDMLTVLPGRFTYGTFDIIAANWSELSHGELINMHHHVHLCIEGMTLQTWTEDGGSRVLGPNTLFHYFDVATTLKEDATTINLWAWTADPNKIPKVQWVTIAAPPAAANEIGHEDYTPGPDGRRSSRPNYTNRRNFRLGVIDGERRISDRTPARRNNDHDQHRREGRDRRRDDDRDEDKDKRGRRDDRAWHQRIFRSCSRATDRRTDERYDDRRSYRGEGSRGDNRGRDERDGRRRAASVDSPRRSHGSATPALIQGRGRSPPASPRALARFLEAEVHLPLARGWAWFPTCLRGQVCPGPDSLPPPPPLPTSGPMPTRYREEAGHFTPTILRRPAPPPVELLLEAEKTVLQAPLLEAPHYTTPRRPAARRKTLAGVTGFAGFPVQRSSPRIKAKQ
uniref:Uncharacterized protein n=1 Tax=Avena sativa TaxID=4498 RepID=A0ACD5U6M1_AVESA